MSLLSASRSMPTKMNKSEIQNLIKEIIEQTTGGLREINVNEENSVSGNSATWFSVEVEEPHFFLGREGEALFALNHLVRRIVEAKTGLVVESPSGSLTTKLPDIAIDINGFQKKRVDNVRAIAHMMAERARYFKANVEIDPMSSFERRIVHEFLALATDLKTESEGMGRGRLVVIKYIGTI